MWKIAKWTLTTLWTLSFGLAVFIFYRWLSGESLSNLPRLLSAVYTNKFIFLGSLVGLGLLILIAFYRDKLHNLEKKVWFYKPCMRLEPSDINPSLTWYDPFFVERPAVKKVVAMLLTGHGAMLLGVPLVGKTRCAFEVLKQLRGYHALGLLKEIQNPAEIQIPRSYLLFKPKLILFLDDLQGYVGKVSISGLYRHLLKQCKSITVLATSRAGDELVLTKRDQAFSSFINQDLQVVSVEELSKDEEKSLAEHFERAWTETAYNGTPGAILFGLDSMQERLKSATDDSRTLMRSLYLMHEAGIQTYGRGLVESIVKKVSELDLTTTKADSAWLWLKDNGFITLQTDTIVPTHPVYIESSFYPDYEFGDPSTDVNTLCQAVSDLGKSQEVFDIATNWGMRRNYLQAETGYRRYVQLSPASPGGHYYLGVALDQQHRVSEAENEFREAIRLNPDYAEAHSYLALVLDDQGLEEEAETEFRYAITLDPNDALTHYNLAVGLGKRGRLEDAEKEFRAAILYNPNDDEAHFGLGSLLDRRGLDKEAEAEFREAIRCNPLNGWAHYALGQTLATKGQTQEAETAYREAIRLNATNEETHYSLGLALEKLGQEEEAEKEFRDAVHLNPKYGDARHALAQLLSRRGRN